MMRRAVVLPICVRVLIAVFTRTFFQPDEYFQALEPAHHIVFGYGHLTWEWLAENPIRSIAYPALNVPIYWLLKVLGLDGTKLLILAPKLLHGVLAAGTDISIQTLASKILGERYVSATLFVSLLSWFHALSLSRSLSNSLETTLTTAALCYFPWDAGLAPTRTQLRKLLLFAALASAVRVTNIILWVYLIPIAFINLASRPALLRSFVVDAFTVASVALVSLTAIDSLYYQKLSITPLSFIAANASPVSLFYGSSPWHYYLSQGLPLLCGFALPSVALGIHRIWKEGSSKGISALGLVLWATLVYSCAGHKEWRFLHPILPLLHIFAAKHLVATHHSRSPRLPVSSINIFIIGLAVPLATYTALFHSHAQISALEYLRALPLTDLRSIGFLMPCHSTPLQSHLHLPPIEVEIWALSCEPPLGLRGKALAAYRDQTDVFYADPLVYLNESFPPFVDASFLSSPMPSTPPGRLRHWEKGWKHSWPSHLVLFGALLKVEGVEGKLEGLGYVEVWSGGNELEEDSRRRGGVRVWRFAGRGS